MANKRGGMMSPRLSTLNLIPITTGSTPQFVMDFDETERLVRGTYGLEINDEPSRPPPFTGYEGEPPPAPQIHSRGVVATEITQVFTEAAEALEIGQLIKDPYFTLFESVGAIEIMDPKMDTGHLAPGETMDDEYDIGVNLLPEEVMGIIDQLLCMEMGWHMGHPLSQTIFTSLYIDKLLSSNSTRLEDLQFVENSTALKHELFTLEILRAYCLGLIKTCWHVNNRVKSEHFYEEEDFVTHTYNRTLLEGVDDALVLQVMQDARLSLQKAKLIRSALRGALDQRLSFRMAFLETVSTADMRDSLNLEELWVSLSKILPGIKSEIEFSKPVPASFSVKIQRKLASTVPPRPVVTVAFDDAYRHLERLCTDGQVVTGVLKYHDSHSLMNFVSLFQTRKPQPSVYIRTLLQHYIFGDMVVLGTLSIRQLLDDDLASLVLPEHPLLDPHNDEIEVPHDPRFNMAAQMEVFRSRAAQSYLDILRTLCQNRCRIRRTLSHTIADWDNLQLDAEELDVELRQFTKEEAVIDPSISESPIYFFPLSSWSYFYKLHQMESIIQMGFELEVYRPDELADMYWYLSHITSTRIRHLERIRGFVMRNFAASRRNQKAHNERDISFGRTLSFVNFSMLEATATQAFADALSCLYVVLARIGVMPTPLLPYSDDAIRYELRMKPFLAIVLPEPIPYETFKLSVNQPNESSAAMINYAADAVARARKDFELLSKLDAKTARYLGSEESWKKNIKDCMRACISASIVISGIKKIVESSGELKLKAQIESVEKGYHDWWVVPKLVSTK